MTTKIDKSNVEDLLPLLPLQKNMLYHYLYQSNPQLYNEINCYTLHGVICPELFVEAWKAVARSNGVLRTVFRWDGLREPVQIVLKEVPVKIEIINIEGIDPDHYYQRVNQCFERLKHQSFDLTQETLRIKLLIQNKETAIMITANHHILFDGWSNALLLDEFKKWYEGLLCGRNDLYYAKISYSNFIELYLKHQKEMDYDYWISYLSGIEVIGKEEELGSENKIYLASLAKDIEDRVRDAARLSCISQASYFYFAWAMTLKIIEQKNDVIFGITLSGRSEQILGIEDAVCLLIRTLPFRVRIQEDHTISQSLMEINDQLNQHQEKAPDSMTKVFEKMNLTNVSFYNSVVVIQNYPVKYGFLQSQGLLKIDIYKRFYKTNFDLNLSIRQFDDTKMDIEYNACKYTESEVFGICSLFVNILKELCIDQTRNLRDFLSHATGKDKKKSTKKIGDFKI